MEKKKKNTGAEEEQKQDTELQLYMSEGAQYSLFEIPSLVQKTRSSVIDEIMYQELSDQFTTLVSDETTKEPDPPVKTKVVLSYEGIRTEGRVKMTPFDHEVIEAVATLVIAGNTHITTSSIFRIIAGKTKNQYISEQQKQRVRESMEKCAFTRIKIDMTDSFADKSDQIENAVFSGNMLSFEVITANSSQGVIDCYKVLSVPAIFRYAIQMGKISEFPIKMLDTPISKTEMSINVQSYLLRRIDRMNRDPNAEHRIPWAEIFAVANQTGAARQALQRLRNTACKILDYWVEFGFLKSYKADNRNKGSILIEPNQEWKPKQLQESHPI